MGDLDELRRFFDDYGKALADVDLAGIAGCYRVPALVLSDAGAVAFSANDEVEAFYADRVQHYHGRGIVAARPSLRSHTTLSRQLLTVDVTWAFLDGEGVTLDQESYRYVLRMTEDEGPQIQVVIATAPA
ncbi:hypothetical protein [Saccharopolyspora taberi]|uniref:SnoaL-like domain-containing protein n=1 Tax=Saccharopolyspora taberi TaxID=60895 RepID=A0ABN3VE81_9PSEU